MGTKPTAASTDIMGSEINKGFGTDERQLGGLSGANIASEQANMKTWDESYAAQVSRIVELFQGKWTVEILCAMREHPVRLSELKRAIPSASKKALTASLRSLEASRVVLRRDLSSSVLHVEYELTERMREPLVMLLNHLAQWGEIL